MRHIERVLDSFARFELGKFASPNVLDSSARHRRKRFARHRHGWSRRRRRIFAAKWRACAGYGSTHEMAPVLRGAGIRSQDLRDSEDADTESPT
jgi:hypothetical protein